MQHLRHVTPNKALSLAAVMFTTRINWSPRNSEKWYWRSHITTSQVLQIQDHGFQMLLIITTVRNTFYSDTQYKHLSTYLCKTKISQNDLNLLDGMHWFPIQFHFTLNAGHYPLKLILEPTMDFNPFWKNIDPKKQAYNLSPFYLQMLQPAAATATATINFICCLAFNSGHPTHLKYLLYSFPLYKSY